MALARSLVVVVTCSVFVVLVDAAIDRGWPDPSGSQWAIYALGLVVIAVGVTVAETLVSRRQRARESAQGTDPTRHTAT